jgi:quinoprotein glucose dehydrogenase
MHAVDSASHKIIWEFKLPTGGYATPAAHSVRGKQYVGIACGGGNRQRTTSGDEYVAFSL